MRSLWVARSWIEILAALEGQWFEAFEKHLVSKLLSSAQAPLQARLTAGGDKLKQEVGSFSVFAPTFKIAYRDPLTLNAKESNRLHGLKTKQKAV